MSTYWGVRRTDFAGSNTLSSANTTAFAPGQPIDVKRIIAVVTTSITSAGSVITVQRRPVAGAAANQVTLGTFTIPVSAAGSVHYFDCVAPVAEATGSDGSKVNVGPAGPFEINPGQDLALVGGGQSAAGAVNFYIEYVAQPFAGPRVKHANAV